MGATQLARHLGVHKSTTFRLLATLEDNGFVDKDPSTDRYRLGYALVSLAAAVTGDLDLTRRARPVLQELAERCFETVNLAILEGDRVVNVDQLTTHTAMVSVNWVGRATPLHCTSSGKVLLAWLSAQRRSRVLSGPLERFTDRTLTGSAELEEHLAQVRELGYAVTVEELETGLNAVAAPVFGEPSGVIAAVSVSGPSYRLDAGRIEEVAQLVKEAGEAISRRMGHRPGSQA